MEKAEKAFPPRQPDKATKTADKKSVSSSEEALLYSFCRLSDDKALEKFHQILIFRELDLPLSVIPPGSGVASPLHPLENRAASPLQEVFGRLRRH